MFLLLHLLIFYNLIIWKPCDSYYPPDKGFVVRIKGKLKTLIRELLFDAITKVESIQQYRKSLSKTTQFQYGSIIYEMRIRHRNMFKLYKSVLDAIETYPALYVVTDERSHLGELVQMDVMAHEVVNLAEMIKVHDANRNADKSKVGYDIFFRRINEASTFLKLVDSLDKNGPPEPPPEENNLSHTGKRRNGLWHYAVPIE